MRARHCGHSTGSRRPSARQEVLLLSETRFSKVDVEVNQSRDNQFSLNIYCSFRLPTEFLSDDLYLPLSDC